MKLRQLENIDPDTTFTKPGTTCSPIAMPEIQQVITVKVKELDGLVQREVDRYIASLPFANVTCITVEKAADLLSVAKDTVRVYIRSGELMASKLGKDYRIRLRDVESFLKEKQTASIVRRMQHSSKKVS